jgi:hypothetical protein
VPCGPGAARRARNSCLPDGSDGAFKTMMAKVLSQKLHRTVHAVVGCTVRCTRCGGSAICEHGRRRGQGSRTSDITRLSRSDCRDGWIRRDLGSRHRKGFALKRLCTDSVTFEPFSKFWCDGKGNFTLKSGLQHIVGMFIHTQTFSPTRINSTSVVHSVVAIAPC